MVIKIAKPSNSMSPGDLFFSHPTEEAEETAFRSVRDECMDLAPASLFGNETLIRQVEKELQVIHELGEAQELLLVRETACLSKELGFPVSTLSREGGLLVLYLLGVSELHPSLFEYSTNPSDLALTCMRKRGHADFCLGIAEPVRRSIQKRLDHVFSHIKCDNRLYEKLWMPSIDALERIGMLAKRTGNRYEEICISDQAMLQAVCEDFPHINQEQRLSVHSPMDAACLYCIDLINSVYQERGNEQEKRQPLYAAVRNNLLQDDMFSILKTHGFSEQEAFNLSRNWYDSKDKNPDIRRMKDHGVPEQAITTFEWADNVWSAASCFARIRWKVMLKYYEIHHPSEYAMIVREQG